MRTAVGLFRCCAPVACKCGEAGDTAPRSHGSFSSDALGAVYCISILAGKYDEVEMYGITVVWQSYTTGGDVLKLAFDTQVRHFFVTVWHSGVALRCGTRL